ncbi:MAG: cyclic nucleotide-binding domain-containing protein [Holophagaceae bacterium]|nr:cyclic nucleotide-binding domain-containing protein [Holophagaceae bacterium]
MPADASLLTDLPLFSALNTDECALLAEAVDTKTMAMGTVLFKAGDPGQAMYVVGKGRMEIFITDLAGQKIILTECGPGEVFGELAMLGTGPRTASAVALEDSELLELDRDDLLLLISKKPEAALHLLGAMGAMTRKADLLLRARVARNPNEEIQEQLTFVQRLADWIAAFSGTT